LSRPLADLQQAVARTLSRIKAVPPRPGFEEVLIPGEPETRIRLQRERDGVPIADDTWQAVRSVAAELGVDVEAIARGESAETLPQRH
jgi:uncharacterized oxidoreductase